MSKTKTIALLCVFGGSKGWGHLSRCVALAQEASRRGWVARLIADGDPSTIPDEAKNAFARIVGPCDWISSLPREALEADILYVDEMYQSDKSIRRIRNQFNPEEASSPLLVATDDMQRRNMGAVDIVVNSEIGLKSASYRPRMRSLLGERYCHLRRPFSLARSFKRREDGLITLFVMIGGTDPFGLTEKALNSLDRKRFAPIVVSGESDDQLTKLLGEFESSEWHRRISGEEVADCVARSHYGVIACGSSVYELAALSLPFVGLSIIDNQTALARKVGTHWRMPIINCEDDKNIGSEARNALGRLMDTYPIGNVRNYSKVDGLGCKRILDACESRV